MNMIDKLRRGARAAKKAMDERSDVTVRITTEEAAIVFAAEIRANGSVEYATTHATPYHMLDLGSEDMLVRVVEVTVPPLATKPLPPATPLSITPALQKVIDAVSWVNTLLKKSNAPRELVAWRAGYSARGGGFQNYLGALRTAGLIDYPQPGTVSLTMDGTAAAARYRTVSRADLREQIFEAIGGAHSNLLKVVLHEDRIMTRAELAEKVQMSAKGGGFHNYVGRLKTLGLIEYPTKGEVRAADWLKER